MTTQTHDEDDDIALLRESAAAFRGRHTDLKRARGFRAQGTGYDPEQRRHMAEAGWFGLLIPEELGGYGGTFSGMAAILRELGAGLAAEPLSTGGVLGTRALVHAPDGALKRELLAQIASGEALAALAWQEDAGGLDLGALTTRATAAGDHVTLSGAKRYVASAVEAQGFLVAAKAGPGLGLYWVERTAPGLTVASEWRVDGTPLGCLTLDNVRLSAAAVIAPPEGGAAILARAIDEALVMAAAETVGVIGAALDLTLGYLRTRTQFGKPIGSFQGLQHRAVDHYVQKRLAEASLGAALEALDGPQTARSFAASRTKIRCSEAAVRITREAVQMHGAIGFTDEYDIGLYLKRAVVLSAWLGSASSHKSRCAALLPEMPALA